MIEWFESRQKLGIILITASTPAVGPTLPYLVGTRGSFSGDIAAGA
jgi:hypothetical protein